MRIIITAFWLIIALIVIFFATANSHSLLINFYFTQVTVYLPLLLFITLVIGAILGILAMIPIVIRNKSRHRKLKQRVKQAEQEVQNLRTIPVKDTH